MSKHYPKDKVIRVLEDYNNKRDKGISQRQSSKDLSIPRKL